LPSIRNSFTLIGTPFHQLSSSASLPRLTTRAAKRKSEREPSRLASVGRHPSLTGFPR
jgi:hypothetical protein